jgi:hypothetical protein
VERQGKAGEVEVEMGDYSIARTSLGLKTLMKTPRKMPRM